MFSHKNTKRAILTSSVLIATLTGAIACGGRPHSTQDASSASNTSSTSLEVTATEFSFDPQNITLSAGEEVSVIFNNEGAVDHEWVVLKEGSIISDESEFSEDLVEFEIEMVPAGTSVTETFTLPASGRYQIVCVLPGHFSAGMQGTLTVN